MPAKTASKATDSANKGKGNFVDDYLADWDDDPFRSLSPEPAKQDAEKGKKKDVLGIETELDLKKKPRVPRVKLDDARLLSDKGIPKLRKTAPRLKFKGKGHEFSDAARLLSFYQEWLDDLFPKATFLDALAMVEKTGHKTTIRNERLKWIDESKPKAADPFDDEDNRIHTSDTRQGERVAPIFENAAAAGRDRAKTPGGDSLFGDDIYSATPRRNTSNAAPPPGEVVDSGIPDDDDLDALMAEAEADFGPSRPTGSIFRNGGARTVVAATGPPDDDDFDALMAEAEAEGESQPPASKPAPATGGGSIFGNGLPKQQAARAPEDDDDDLDALMAEVEAERESRPAERAEKLPSQTAAAKPAAEPAKKSSDFEDDDDLDALMAEVEGEGGSTADAKNISSTPAGTAPDIDDEAMAEMDGL